MFDRSKLVVRPLSEREHKFTIDKMWKINDWFPICAFPQLDELANEINAAKNAYQPVIWMMGAHPIRRGNSRLIIDLLARGKITHIATSGAGAIHDLEFALIGATCEDVERYIKDGSFGNWEETAREINGAAKEACRKKIGFGQKRFRVAFVQDRRLRTDGFLSVRERRSARTVSRPRKMDD